MISGHVDWRRRREIEHAARGLQHRRQRRHRRHRRRRIGHQPADRCRNSGTIITEGNGAYGIFAQSLGGGGGNSSSILSLTAAAGSKDNGTFGFNFGAIGGDGNTGGNVTVDNSGLVQTAGEGAHGIFAQSIGGGGGNGGLVLAANILIGAPTSAPLIAIGGVGGDGGDGGDVTVTNSGQILTTGANADGILAQSIGGGGGNSSMGFGLTGEPYTLVIGNALSAIVGATGGGTGGEPAATSPSTTAATSPCSATARKPSSRKASTAAAAPSTCRSTASPRCPASLTAATPTRPRRPIRW